jgi:hypothetical protein
LNQSKIEDSKFQAFLPTLSEAYLHAYRTSASILKTTTFSNLPTIGFRMFGQHVRHFTTRIRPGFDAAKNMCNRRLATLERLSERSFSSSAAPKQTKQTFFEWYESHLQSSPIKTKMATGSLLWGLGDFVAQSTSGVERYDFLRTGRAVFFGFAIHAPASHLHFNFLEWMTVRSGVTGLGIPVFKTIMEQVRKSV